MSRPLKTPIDRTKGLKKLPAQIDRQSAGTSARINLAPGSDDDGWVIPPPIQLSDGTQIQLYKDGEAWHAAFEAMKLATHRICLELYIFASDHVGRGGAVVR